MLDNNFPRGIHLKKNLLLRILFLTIIVSLSACATYSSRPYQPSSSTGQEAFKKARKDIYPLQVRSNPAMYGEDTIVWAGIVSNVEVFQSRYGPSVSVQIEHRYFDWIEDHGAQPEVFFLSPRGEGEFIIFVKPDEKLSEREAKNLVPVGTMVVAVGKIHVKTAQDKTRPLALMTEYHQFIGRKWYRSDIFDYGRENEPITKVKDSEYWKKYDKK